MNGKQIRNKKSGEMSDCEIQCTVRKGVTRKNVGKSRDVVEDKRVTNGKQENNREKKTESRDITSNIFPRISTNDLWKFHRTENYRLQGIVRDWFYECGKEIGLEYPANYNLTAKCLYTRYKRDVSIAKNVEQAYYLGLIRCSRIWSCPVCAAKIQTERKKEVKKVIDWAYQNKKKCMMVTFTFPHYFGQSADGLMNRFSKALAYLRGGKQWQNVKSQIGFEGLIRGLEVTRGDNGWHIHTHEIWIVDKFAYMLQPSCQPVISREDSNDSVKLARNYDVASWLQDLLTERWIKAVKRNGLLSDSVMEACRRYGVKIRDNVHNGDYLLKHGLSKTGWGCDSEVTVSHRKGGKQSKDDFVGVDPFDLIRDGRKEEFLEYAKAFHGRSQLHYSSGLKGKAGIDDIEDKEIVEMEDKADVLGTLTADDWRIILKNDARVKILEIAEKMGILDVRAFIHKLSKVEQ